MKRSREGSPKHNLDSQPEPERSIYRNAGKWVRGKLLGRGGFGSVYLATLIEPGSRYNGFPPIMAVKSTYTSTCDQLENEKQFLDLFVGNPFIIRCFGDDITISQDNQAMLNVFLEYASGGSLGDVIRKANHDVGLGLREPLVKQYTESILRGVRCIHERGIVHCDLKPDNILMVEEDDCLVPKIADFGLSKLIVDGHSCDDTVGGTRMYLAPETVMIRRQDQASDIWALGCVVLQMLSGKLPWDAYLETKELEQKIASEFPSIPSGVSIEAEDFLMKCFTRNPNDRPSADMLLSHPFVCGHEIIDLTSEDQIEEEPSEEVEIVDLTSEDQIEEDPCEEVEIVDLTSEEEDPSEEDPSEDEEKCCSLTHEIYEDDRIMHRRQKRPAISRPICPQSPVFTLIGAR